MTKEQAKQIIYEIIKHVDYDIYKEYIPETSWFEPDEINERRLS